MSTQRLLLLIFCLLGAHSLPCAAHFSVADDDCDGHVTMFFSESPQTTRLPSSPALAETPIWGRSLATPERVAIACDTIDRQELIGRQSTAPTQAELLELEQVYASIMGHCSLIMRSTIARATHSVGNNWDPRPRWLWMSCRGRPSMASC